MTQTLTRDCYGLLQQTLIITLLAAMLFTGHAHAQTAELSDTGMRLDGIAAVVNDGIVLRSDLAQQIQTITQRLEEQKTEMPPAAVLNQQILDRLVLIEIQKQRAERLGIQVTEENLNQAMAEVARRNNTTLTQLPELLSRDGIDFATYRRDLREQITLDQLRQRDVMSKISVAPRELDDYMAREAGRAYLKYEYKISYILISVSENAGPEAVNVAQQRAQEVYDKASRGEDFATLAISYSNGQNALDGGSMEWRRGDALPTLFAIVVPSLTVGKIAPPERSSSGFHIVRLDGIRGGEPIIENQVWARHILLKTTEIMDDDAARDKLIKIREQIQGGDDFEAIAKAVSDDPASGADGGDLGWSGPTSFVPEFNTVIDGLGENVISEPFKTRYGWHIVEVLGRRVHDTTEDVRRRDAIMAIRESKLEEETEIWLRRLRDEAFVEYRI